jgi:hypothetical protein
MQRIDLRVCDLVSVHTKSIHLPNHEDFVHHCNQSVHPQNTTTDCYVVASDSAPGLTFDGMNVE